MLIQEIRHCLLCQEIVASGKDKRTWGIQWGPGWVHFDCAQDIGAAVARIASSPPASIDVSEVRQKWLEEQKAKAIESGKTAMKASDVIARLVALIAEHGDLPVFTSWEWTVPLVQDDDTCGAHYHPENDPTRGGAGDYFPERIEIA